MTDRFFPLVEKQHVSLLNTFKTRHLTLATVFLFLIKNEAWGKLPLVRDVAESCGGGMAVFCIGIREMFCAFHPTYTATLNLVNFVCI